MRCAPAAPPHDGARQPPQHRDGLRGARSGEDGSAGRAEWGTPAGVGWAMDTAPFASPDTELTAVPGGGWLLSSRTPLAEHEGSVGEMLRAWAGAAGDRLLVAERDASGAWRRVTYAEARAAADAIAQALLDRGLGPQRPVAVLSGNSVDHALLMLGCFTAGVPIVPVSAAYSLQSRDFTKLRQVPGDRMPS